MEYANMKFPPLHGLFLKTMDISKRMSNQSLEDFIRNGCLFSGYEYAGLPDIEVYPIQNKTVQSGHSEVWIAIRKGE